MLTNKMLAAIVAACMVVACVSALDMTDDSDASAYVADPTISDVGFLVDQPSLFYYAKFIDLGFPFTSGSVSADTPELGVGENMFENSVFVDLSKLDQSKTYKVKVSERSSAAATEERANFVTTIDVKSTHAFLWYSIESGHNNTVYVCGKEASTEFSSNKLLTSVGTQVYTITLMDSEGNTIEETTLGDLAHFTKIVEVTTLDYNESYENDLLQTHAKNHGFSRSSKTKYEYAASVLNSTGYDQYVYSMFITNLDKPVIELKGNTAYKFTDDQTFFHMDSTGKELSGGYGCVAISKTALNDSNFTSVDSYSISVGDGKTVYATAEYSQPSSDDGNGSNMTFIGAAGIVAVLVLAGAAIIAHKKGVF